jgi:hypothetical protein
MQQSLTTDYYQDYKKSLETIDKLESTPSIIKHQAISALEHALNQQGISHQAKQALRNSKELLENLSDKSIKSNFKIIYAQMCILAVSSLEAILKRYFENAAIDSSNINREYEKLSNLKLSLKEIFDNDLKFGGKIGKLILEKDNQINFQDLKSIKNVLKNYFMKDIVLDDSTEKNVCFYLEIRHLLVHKGGRVDDKFISATKVMNANIKNYEKNDLVELDENDWKNIKISFLSIVKETTKQRVAHKG